MSFSARVDSDNTQPVIIKSLDSEQNLCVVEGRYSGEFSVKLGTSLASVVQYPAPGEQWLVQRILGGWQLHSRLDFQDDRVLPIYPPGSTVFGSSGETHIVGGSIHLDSADVQVDGTTLGEYVTQKTVVTMGYGEFIPKRVTTIDQTPGTMPLKKNAGSLDFTVSESGIITIPRTGVCRVTTRVYTIERSLTHLLLVNGTRAAIGRDSLYQLLSLKKDDLLTFQVYSPTGSLQIDPQDKGAVLTLEYASS